MGVKHYMSGSLLANYGKAIRSAPPRVLWNRHVLFTALIYAMCGIPQCWDQGTSATVPSLKGFQVHFGTTSGADADQIRTFVSIVYAGYIIGAAGSFLINNRIGRLWSFRLYALIYIIGQLIATFSPNLSCLYVARVISGIGIGSITVTGPVSIVEIAPAETRGLLTAWYPVTMSISLFSSNMCVYGIYKHLPTSKLQFMIAFFSVCIWMLICIVASFSICESPRWLFMMGRRDEAIQTLVRLRNLPADHPRVQLEAREIEDDIHKSTADASSSFTAIIKEAFTVTSNLRRLQQVLLSYALAQLSGANSITSYFVPVMEIIGNGKKSTSENLFLSGMYSFSKIGFSIIASFFFIDALGQRKSLLIGASIQCLSHLYIGIYVKKTQEGPVTNASSEGALAALFIHAFGYSIACLNSLCLLILPYVFAGEIWPNRIRSFGAALGATWHWGFVLALKYSIPSLLSSTHQWGAFIFFAAWCAVAWLYVFFMVPEVGGMSVEEIDGLFEGPWFQAWRQKRPLECRDSVDEEEIIHPSKQ